ncbi:CvfD/Ygs/GSP13 family RNA-binding post-transcriptional regulator [Vagococcus vulneris]|uniref:RNA-binding protein n=1 Tax=Vagococcus vulneris TaxID=1977869 RepID=A0A429ZNV4_9ENTE|nr:CvfD/Ygs/GSP13 family RNA-binding post-transcriptional regulator [Vagococcus vulneris]RST95390.1 RNA-binding protein [Vagococcus vulneris]
MEYKIGMVLTGQITGVQPYGAFVSLSQNHQGLIHVSEVRHGFVKNIFDELSVGEQVRVRIIDVDEYTKKISLSMRVLEEVDSKVITGMKRKRYFTNRKKKIGFESIEKKLDSWIDEAIDDILEK